MRKLALCLVGAGALTVAMGVTARAWEANPQCVADAVETYLDCKNLCRDDFRTQKDLCRNVDHDCAETCRTNRENCLNVDPGALAALRACVGGCRTDLDGDITECKTVTCPEGMENREACLDTCIDAAQVVAFQCRDGCRETARPGIKGCRELFRYCIRNCPPANPGS